MLSKVEQQQYERLVAPLLNAGLCLWQAREHDFDGTLRKNAESLIRQALSHMKPPADL